MMLLRDVDCKVISNEETAELTGKVPNTVFGWEGMERPEQWFITVDRGRPEVKGGTVRVTGQHRKWDTR